LFPAVNPDSDNFLIATLRFATFAMTGENSTLQFGEGLGGEEKASEGNSQFSIKKGLSP
jgi:hypothetical protein